MDMPDTAAPASPTTAQTVRLGTRDQAQPSSLLDGITLPSDLRRLSPRQLPRLAAELRQAMIQSVSRTGGHLGSGLGVVELTVALHYVFDTPSDKLIWDVSHQCYPHKMLTGRRAWMARLRQSGGPAGFTSRQESDYDPFGAAHSSTAISAALGFATARDLGQENHHVVAIVGDGAASGGMAFEGLNNLGAQRRRVIVILNDNNMSIAPPSGALVAHLGALRAQMPERDARRAAMATTPLPSFAETPTLFDQLGITYCGPFDGHDVGELIDVLSAARDRPDGGPVLIHVATEKGHGYAPAAMAKDCFHGVARFDVASGRQEKSPASAPSYTQVFSDALIGAAARDPAIAAVTAAMPSGTGLDRFGDRFPERCFDVGIAEQHAVTFAAGLACGGMKPFVAIYSTFLQRGYDQIVHDVAIQRLPVRFAIDRAGLVGADGVTHQGAFDVSYLGCLPGFVLMAPADESELARMVATAAAIDDRPSAFRYPRGNGTGILIPSLATPLEIGRGRIVREGADVAILSYGTTLGRALAAADMLSRIGITATVADARFAKPVDARLVAMLAREHRLLFTLEEAAVGGFATQVFDALGNDDHRGVDTARVVALHLPDRFIEHGNQSEQEAWAGLDARALAHRIAVAMGSSGSRELLAAE